MTITQSIHYTFDLRSSPLASVMPIDIQYPRNSTGDQNSDQTGGFPLYIPGGVDYDPANAASGAGYQSWYWVNAEKQNAIQASYPGYSYILYDDMEDASSFDPTTSSGMFLGGRGSFMLGDYGSNSTITTNAIALFGSAPDEAFVWIDGGHYVDSLETGMYEATGYSNPKTGRCQRYFQPQSAGYHCIIDVSFNGGSTWVTNVFDGHLINIPVADQGTSFKMRLTRRNTSTYVHRVLILGWGLVY